MAERRLNKQAAEIFRECAEILRHQAANPFRVNAYVRAANVLDALQDDVHELLEKDGTDGLVKLLDEKGIPGSVPPGRRDRRNFTERPAVAA